MSGSSWRTIFLDDISKCSKAWCKIFIKYWPGFIFLDFGLAHRVPEVEIEPLGVDLHLLRRVLDSTNHSVADQCFRFDLQGHRKEYGKKSEEIIQRLEQIESRGRYRVKQSNLQVKNSA